MIACLPMYDWPELVAAHDALWRDISHRLQSAGIDAPAVLTRAEDDESHWLAPDLLLGQTCGYPFATVLRGKVQYLTTPVYDVEGCSGPYYSSTVVVRKDSALTIENLRNGCFAYNGKMSLSGYQAVKAMVGDPQAFFVSMVESGGHRASAGMVAKGDADVTALDGVCWHLLQVHEPETAAGLKVIGWTEKRPSLPLITALETGPAVVEKLRTILSEVVPSEALAIGGFEVVDLEKYDALSKL